MSWFGESAAGSAEDLFGSSVVFRVFEFDDDEDADEEDEAPNILAKGGGDLRCRPWAVSHVSGIVT